MLKTVAKRATMALTVLLLVSIGTFLLVELVPGDPALEVLGPNSSAEDYSRVRLEMGLDEPVAERFVTWLGDAIRGDLGKNLVPPVENVSDRLGRAVPVNVELAAIAIVLALLISIPLAMWSAYRAGSRFDRVVTASMFGIISVPGFVAGLLLLLVFAVYWRVFPFGQWARPTQDGWAENLKHAFLPALTLSLNEIAVFTRVLRGDMIATLREDYILAARAKACPPATSSCAKRSDRRHSLS